MNYLIDELEKQGVEVLQPERSESGWVRMRLKRGDRDIRFGAWLHDIETDPNEVIETIEELLTRQVVPPGT